MMRMRIGGINVQLFRHVQRATLTRAPHHVHHCAYSQSHAPKCLVALASSDDAILRKPDSQDEMKMLIESCNKVGIEAKVIPWTCAETDWGQYSAVLICQTWDYTSKQTTFMNWLENVSKTSKLFNSLPILKWNMNKIYLKQLQDEYKLPIVPTIFVTAMTLSHKKILLALVNAQRWKSLVVKPSIGCDGDGVVCFPRCTSKAMKHMDLIVAHASYGGPGSGQVAMIQPFLDSILSRGEVSLIYIDGVFSHSVRKFTSSSAVDEFRVQEKFGGGHERIHATEDMLALGKRAIAAIDDIFSKERPPNAKSCTLYARVDLVFADHLPDSEDVEDSGSDRLLLISEVELLEPHLYMSHGKHASQMLAQGVHDRVIV